VVGLSLDNVVASTLGMAPVVGGPPPWAWYLLNYPSKVHLAYLSSGLKIHVTLATFGTIML
jgi:hypothetical protein